MLVMAQPLKEISQPKETLTFLLQNLGLCNTSEGNRVLGVSDKFSKHDVSLTSGKSFGYLKQMHATYSITKDHNYGINQTPRKTLVHCPGSACRENSVQVYATTNIYWQS